MEKKQDYALKDLGQTFHELMGVFVSMNLIVDEVQQATEFPPQLRDLAKQAGARMNELLPRLQAFYARIS